MDWWIITCSINTDSINLQESGNLHKKFFESQSEILRDNTLNILDIYVYIKFMEIIYNTQEIFKIGNNKKTKLWNKIYLFRRNIYKIYKIYLFHTKNLYYKNQKLSNKILNQIFNIVRKFIYIIK